MWGPLVISWFISPNNYSYLRTINRTYWSYVHQLSYRLGAPLCRSHKPLANMMGTTFYAMMGVINQQISLGGSTGSMTDMTMIKMGIFISIFLEDRVDE